MTSDFARPAFGSFGRLGPGPPAVDEVRARVLAKSPDVRYARCGEFAAALQQALAPAYGSVGELTFG